MSEVNPIDHVVSLIKISSENENMVNELKLSLRIINIKKLDFNRSITLLHHLVSCTYKNQSPPTVLEVVLSAWCANDDNIDGVIGDLASMMIIHINILTYICKTLNQKITLYDILENVIQSRQEPNIGFAITADRLILAFKENPDNTFWKDLLNIAIEAGKTDETDVLLYINDKIGESSEPVSKPKWVNILPNEDINLLNIKCSSRIPSHDLLQKTICASEQNLSIKDSDNIRELVETYIVTSIKEELELLEGSNSIDDTKITIDNLSGRPERIWGPVNAMLDRNCIYDNGPCRMLTCICRDTDQAYDEEPESTWFNGKCDVCRRRILDISYALRFPVTNGGWVGCFCSWSCMKKKPPRPIFGVEMMAISRIKAVIKEFGIFDRAYSK